MPVPRYMLDTNVVILTALGRGGVIERIEDMDAGEVVVSALTLAELERGWQAGRDDRAAAMTLFAFVPILSFDATAAAAFGRITAGQTRAPKYTFDRLIGAHALSLGLTVVTADKTGFANIEGLSVEDWSA